MTTQKNGHEDYSADVCLRDVMKVMARSRVARTKIAEKLCAAMAMFVYGVGTLDMVLEGMANTNGDPNKVCFVEGTTPEQIRADALDTLAELARNAAALKSVLDGVLLDHRITVAAALVAFRPKS